MKNKLFICMLGLLAVALMSTSAFAQSTLSVSSVPRTTATSTGHTEIAGDVQINTPGAGGLGAGSATLNVDYGVPITVASTSGLITICGTGSLVGLGAACPGGIGNLYTAATTGATQTFTIGGANQNQLLIVLPTSGAGAGVGSLTITGVKVSLVGFAGTTLNATLGVGASATFGAYSIASGQNISTIISTISPAFSSLVASGSTAVPAGLGTGQLLSTAAVSDRQFNVDVPEVYPDAFKSTLGTAGFLNDPQITFTFNNLPAGVFLNLLGGSTANTSNASCSADAANGPQFYTSATGGGVTTINPGNLSNPVISNSANSTVLSITANMVVGGPVSFNNSALETIRLRGCIYTSGATAPLALGTVTVTATLSPNGTALSAGAQIGAVAGNFPRYANTPVTLNIITIIAAETDMLISFAVKNTGGFDTGIAIANTSTDSLTGSLATTPNEGNLTLGFYPQGSGSSFSYTTTTGSPGQGLGSGGVLATGKTWSVLLSELLGGITGAPTAFTGYIFIRANFTNAHGAAYVTDFKGFTSSSPFLIVPTGRATAAEALGH